ncbi:MAG: ornithine cyclodeaminase family protein [Candidatus Aminicenantales bacterium]
MKIKIISRKDVRQAVGMAEAVSAVRKAYEQFSAGKAVLPLRIQVPVENYGGVTLFMPAYLSRSNVLGAKIVSVFPRNEAQNLPTIHAAVIIVEAQTGKPLALMDGTYLTALRTGASSGVATELLAGKNASTAAIIGAGAQARTQLEAVCSGRRIKKVFVYDISYEQAEEFVREMKEFGPPIPSHITRADTPEQAVEEADVICTATTSTTPVFSHQALKPGVHINAIGSFTPERQEIPEETVCRSKIVVDSRKAALEEAGDLIIPIRKGMITENHIYAEIGEIAVGKLPARETEEEITLFKSVGLAIQDVAVAEVVLRRAEELKVGKEVEI